VRPPGFEPTLWRGSTSCHPRVVLSPQFQYFPWLYVFSNARDVVGGAGGMFTRMGINPRVGAGEGILTPIYRKSDAPHPVTTRKSPHHNILESFNSSPLLDPPMWSKNHVPSCFSLNKIREGEHMVWVLVIQMSLMPFSGFVILFVCK
jgi:hypothetical protein